MNKEGRTIKVPNAIKKMLLADEQVMAVVKQSRLKAAITPDSIIVTNQRIIRCSPSALGLRKEIEDYRYEDIANLKIDKGILFATITARRRFMSQDLILDKLLKGQADYISRVIQENLGRMSSTTKFPVAANQPGPLVPLEDPLQILKLRFARGEITKQQFEEMKRALE
ncbi:MAG: PH domain-containing protein [Dehalococcoidia bacterium]|nr:PH domain-containing protein [Dehalococcoidia bacterium]MDH4367588.1 PH domain-containing protein [Dehalococcoidia bacterium]